MDYYNRLYKKPSSKKNSLDLPCWYKQKAIHEHHSSLDKLSFDECHTHLKQNHVCSTAYLRDVDGSKEVYAAPTERYYRVESTQIPSVNEEEPPTTFKIKFKSCQAFQNNMNNRKRGRPVLPSKHYLNKHKVKEKPKFHSNETLIDKFSLIKARRNKLNESIQHKLVVKEPKRIKSPKTTEKAISQAESTDQKPEVSSHQKAVTIDLKRFGLELNMSDLDTFLAKHPSNAFRKRLKVLLWRLGKPHLSTLNRTGFIKSDIVDQTNKENNPENTENTVVDKPSAKNVSINTEQFSKLKSKLKTLPSTFLKQKPLFQDLADHQNNLVPTESACEAPDIVEDIEMPNDSNQNANSSTPPILIPETDSVSHENNSCFSAFNNDTNIVYPYVYLETKPNMNDLNSNDQATGVSNNKALEEDDTLNSLSTGKLSREGKENYAEEQGQTNLVENLIESSSASNCKHLEVFVCNRPSTEDENTTRDSACIDKLDVILPSQVKTEVNDSGENNGEESNFENHCTESFSTCISNPTNDNSRPCEISLPLTAKEKGSTETDLIPDMCAPSPVQSNVFTTSNKSKGSDDSMHTVSKEELMQSSNASTSETENPYFPPVDVVCAVTDAEEGRQTPKENFIEPKLKETLPETTISLSLNIDSKQLCFPNLEESFHKPSVCSPIFSKPTNKLRQTVISPQNIAPANSDALKEAKEPSENACVSGYDSDATVAYDDDDADEQLTKKATRDHNYISCLSPPPDPVIEDHPLRIKKSLTVDKLKKKEVKGLEKNDSLSKSDMSKKKRNIKNEHKKKVPKDKSKNASREKKTLRVKFKNSKKSDSDKIKVKESPITLIISPKKHRSKSHPIKNIIKLHDVFKFEESDGEVNNVAKKKNTFKSPTKSHICRQSTVRNRKRKTDLKAEQCSNINSKHLVEIPSDEDDLPKILPPKRRRTGKHNEAMKAKTIEPSDMERLMQEFPRHNWLENKYKTGDTVVDIKNTEVTDSKLGNTDNDNVVTSKSYEYSLSDDDTEKDEDIRETLPRQIQTSDSINIKHSITGTVENNNIPEATATKAIHHEPATGNDYTSVSEPDITEDYDDSLHGEERLQIVTDCDDQEADDTTCREPGSASPGNTALIAVEMESNVNENGEVKNQSDDVDANKNLPVVEDSIQHSQELPIRVEEVPIQQSQTLPTSAEGVPNEKANINRMPSDSPSEISLDVTGKETEDGINKANPVIGTESQISLTEVHSANISNQKEEDSFLEHNEDKPVESNSNSENCLDTFSSQTEEESNTGNMMNSLTLPPIPDLIKVTIKDDYNNDLEAKTTSEVNNDDCVLTQVSISSEQLVPQPIDSSKNHASSEYQDGTTTYNLVPPTKTVMGRRRRMMDKNFLKKQVEVLTNKHLYNNTKQNHSDDAHSYESEYMKNLRNKIAERVKSDIQVQLDRTLKEYRELEVLEAIKTREAQKLRELKQQKMRDLQIIQKNNCEAEISRILNEKLSQFEKKEETKTDIPPPAHQKPKQDIRELLDKMDKSQSQIPIDFTIKSPYSARKIPVTESPGTGNDFNRNKIAQNNTRQFQSVGNIMQSNQPVGGALMQHNACSPSDVNMMDKSRSIRASSAPAVYDNKSYAQGHRRSSDNVQWHDQFTKSAPPNVTIPRMENLPSNKESKREGEVFIDLSTNTTDSEAEIQRELNQALAIKRQKLDTCSKQDLTKSKEPHLILESGNFHHRTVDMPHREQMTSNITHPTNTMTHPKTLKQTTDARDLNRGDPNEYRSRNTALNSFCPNQAVSITHPNQNIARNMIGQVGCRPSLPFAQQQQAPRSQTLRLVGATAVTSPLQPVGQPVGPRSSFQTYPPPPNFQINGSIQQGTPMRAVFRNFQTPEQACLRHPVNLGPISMDSRQLAQHHMQQIPVTTTRVLDERMVENRQHPGHHIRQIPITAARAVDDNQTSTCLQQTVAGIPMQHQLITRQPIPTIPSIPGNMHISNSTRMRGDDTSTTTTSAYNMSNTNNGNINQHININGKCVICQTLALYLCSNCQKYWYCSQECQLKHWVTHQHDCKNTAAT